MHALVLELVEGPTLADRIAAGPIPVDHAMPIARQIAEALEAAHERGIVHRDLKPANIKLRPDGTVKVLDFGLAKVLQPEAVAGDDVTPSPTITSPSMIQRGVILGTAAYVSPEQARGREADRRSDIWAFGAVLYEMLSGRRAFQGDDVSDTIAAVLRQDVDWSALDASTPASVRRLLARCLDRDARRRLRDIGEARILLEDPAAATVEGSLEPAVAPARPPVAAPHGASGGGHRGRGRGWRGPLAPDAYERHSRHALRALDDGGHCAFGGSAVSRPHHHARRHDTSSTRVGAEVTARGCSCAGWGNSIRRRSRCRGCRKVRSPHPTGNGLASSSPLAGVALKKVAITGGPSVELSRVDGPSRGATWGDDDTIILATAALSTGLQRVSSAGGAPAVLTTPDHERGESDHLWPQFLPGSHAVLFTITASEGGHRCLAGGGARRGGRHMEDGDSRRQSGPVRAERPPRVRGGRRALGRCVRPRAHGDERHGESGRVAGRDPADRHGGIRYRA